MKTLDDALASLPRHNAPPALRDAIYARYVPSKRKWLARASAALAIAAAAALFVGGSDHSDSLDTEAVNDHLRVLYSDHPVEIESGGIHQVKPWFAGRLDFAPTLAYAGDADYPLKGGSVAYFMDRKAAAFVFARRLHTITLFVFRADGLPWPRTTGTHARTTRGFHTLLWREGDLGYALVSDVSEPDLRGLAERIENAK